MIISRFDSDSGIIVLPSTVFYQFFDINVINPKNLAIFHVDIRYRI